MKKVIYYCIPGLLTVLAVVYSCGRSGTGHAQEAESGISNDSLISRGEYLVMIAGCNDCHSPKILGPNGPEINPLRMLSGYQSGQPVPDFPKELIKKGFVVFNSDATATMGPWGTSFAANITSDETGIGNWSEEQFKKALTHGKYKGLDGGRMLMPPMPWQNYQQMKDEDVRAIFAYLKSTDPVDNIVPAFRQYPSAGDRSTAGR